MSCARGRDEVRPKPSWDQRMHDDAAADPGEVADGVEGDLRVVGAGLHAEVAAAALGIELVAGQRRELDQRRRALSARPKRSAPSRSKNVGPEAERDRQLRGRQAEGLAGVLEAAPGRPATRRRACARSLSRAAAAVQRAQQVLHVGARRRRRGRTRRRGAGPAPAWRCRPGARRGTATTSLTGVGAAPSAALERRATAPPATMPPAASPAVPGKRRRFISTQSHYECNIAATWDSGSASASTCCAACAAAPSRPCRSSGRAALS